MNNIHLTSDNIIDEAMRVGLEISGCEFPIDIFPRKIRRIIMDLNEGQGFPIDYTAAAMFTAIAVAIGNTHLVQIKRNWTESAILYMALIGRPGANKSHPLSFAMQPFIEYDYKENQTYLNEYAQYEKAIVMNKKERIENGMDEFPCEPKRKRFLVSDITPEGLSFIHSQNPRGLCLWSDELSAWFKNFNRYNAGSEEQFWLSVFNAKPTISDRKSAKSSIFIRRPYISVIGTIQKKVLNELARGERSCNGFIDRILFIMPDLQHKARWSDKEPTYDARQIWHDMIGKLLNLKFELSPDGGIEPHILYFDEDAKELLYEWQHNFSQICDQENNDTIVGIYCKLEIYIIRFCLIIQIAKWICNESDKEFINIETVHKAIQLTDYFRKSALKVQQILNEEILTDQQKAVVDQLPATFTSAQIIKIAQQNGMKERTCQRFLNDNVGILFRKIKHGEYLKISACQF